MQRTISRSQFPATIFDLECALSRSSAWCTLLTAIAFVLAGRGFASAADPDNILLDFTAVWCEPCQKMSSIVSKLERQGLPIRKVDVDQEPGLAKKYGVSSIPCFVLVSKGAEVDRVNGITSEQQLRSMINRLPKASAVAQGPEARRNEGSEPTLGTPIPLTPKTSTPKPPRQSPPPSFGTSDREEQSLPDPEELIRSQSPDADPFRSSVRIRVKDGNAVIYGSGTIIDSQPGSATILTCAHIFRKLSKSAVIEIDVYLTTKSKPETMLGRVVLTDTDADLGLVTINSTKRLASMRLGVSGAPLHVDDRMFSIGCGGGDNPSREELKLTSINKYDGPENLECTGRPQEGRSGGGLFRDDELVGVCVAADPDVPRGIYTGLRPISLLLEKAGLANLASRTPKSQPGSLAIVPTEQPKNGFSDSHVQPHAQIGMADEDLAKLLVQQMDNRSTGGASVVPDDLAGAEIICIIRSRTPGKPSRLVIVNQATERFVADLLNEMGNGTGRDLNALGGNLELTPNRGRIETSLEMKQFQRPIAK